MRRHEFEGKHIVRLVLIGLVILTPTAYLGYNWVSGLASGCGGGGDTTLDSSVADGGAYRGQRGKDAAPRPDQGPKPKPDSTPTPLPTPTPTPPSVITKLKIHASATNWVRQGVIKVGPPQAVDRKEQTAWCVTGGPGEALILSLPSPTRVTGIRLINGYAKDSAWRRNNRVKTLQVVAGTSAISRQLEDTQSWQRVMLDAAVTTRTVKLTISSVHPHVRGGDNDTCISEVQILQSE